MNINRSNNLYTVLFALVACLAITGCITDELPIAPYDRGGVERAQVTMAPDYRFQIYFDLETGIAVQQNRISDWDIGFECAGTGYYLVLNGSKAMSAFDAGLVDFSAVTSSAGAVWRYDTPDGNLDSTAIGTWWKQQGDSVLSLNHVYIIDRGYNEVSKHQGYRKLTVVSYNHDAYRIRTAALNGTDEHYIDVPIDSTRNFVAVSLLDGTIVNAEPPRQQWDILFTRYTHLFYEPLLTPYSVTGVLLNRYETSVAIDSTKDFATITSADLSSFTFSTARDGIGYGWKSYDLNKGIYTVYPSINYIIKTSTGFFYKFHFVDFYDSTGQKGTPIFEFQKL